LAIKLAEGTPLRLIDVRTPLEFAEVHAESAASVPLDQLSVAALEAVAPAAGMPLYLLCKSGSRAAKACDRLAAEGCGNAVVVDGGTDAWIAAGLPVVRRQNVLSLERQVRIGAGALVLISVALGWLVHRYFFGLAAFVGAGLVFAGVTNFCGMGLLIARMPWNRNAACKSCKA
jgi:rhodanese-related sulfurtransferase